MSISGRASQVRGRMLGIGLVHMPISMFVGWLELLLQDMFPHYSAPASCHIASNWVLLQAAALSTVPAQKLAAVEAAATSLRAAQLEDIVGWFQKHFTIQEPSNAKDPLSSEVRVVPSIPY